MTLRLALTAMEGWDDFCGALALEGIDPRGWDLTTLVNAFEVYLARTFDDDKKRAAWRRELYDPPKEEKEAMVREAASRRSPPSTAARRGRGLTPGAAAALLAAVQAQDAGAG